MGATSDKLAILSANQFETVGGVPSRKSPIELNQMSPTSILDGDPFAFSTISYPRDVTQDMANGHYMLFYVNVQNKTKYKYTDANTGLGVLEKTMTPITREDEQHGLFSKPSITDHADTEASYRTKQIKKGGKGNILKGDASFLSKGKKPLTGFNSVLATTTRITDSVAIYLPPNVKDSTTASYNAAAEMGVIGLAAAGGVNFVNAMRRNDFAGASDALVGSAKGLILEAAKNMGSELVGGLTNVDPQAIQGFANKAFGQANNPFMEVLFESVGMRTFSYDFTFSPRSPEETLDVQTIIKLFRFHMLPELQGANERFLTLPSTFDIHYMYQLSADNAKENSFYSKIATCVLTGCDVDYAPDGVKSFESGAPTQIKMSLAFQETEMLTKQHVDAGF